MNLTGCLTTTTHTGFPHTRGDEPFVAALDGHDRTVFPTRVGMNLVGSNPKTLPVGFPHTRGDEPHFISGYQNAFMFSPHAWG